ncbi:MAG: DUF3151 family protein [Acidimicrobiaceae bacterium]|nr:DUF3151 family protein [Acidimicrobiaceae bacterium]MCY4279742.1 DUF3151 family protein [Acidimicrobiaceae bacterium]MCY4293941.1 DUF3151 family protein [Acidimicrobiaceae bacterium]
MNDPVSLLSQGPPETVLPPEPEDVRAALAEAAASSEPVAAFGSVCVRWPQCLDAWAGLGECLEAGEATPALAYAAFRTGYHRGLDRLRAGGWRGSGHVRWRHATNRGFLRALSGLQRVAAEIGEHAEAQRCAVFLMQLDPEWPPSDDAFG